VLLNALQRNFLFSQETLTKISQEDFTNSLLSLKLLKANNMFRTDKIFSPFIILIVLLGGSLATLPVVLAQSGTNVSYLIGTDTTWTQAKSPYNFVGNVAVDRGATLTIGAGATVNLNAYYLRVNGSLIIQPGATINLGLIGDGIDVYGILTAAGTPANPIHINGGIQGHIIFSAYSAVTFFPSSTGWSRQTSSGSLIENTVFNQTGLELQSPIKVSDSTFLSGGLVAESASPIIINNNIASGLSVIKNPNTPGTIYNQGNGSCVIEPEISNNTITGGLYLMAGGGIVEDNVISVGSNNPNSGYIGALSISDEYGVPISTLIQRNLIKDSSIGISFNIQYGQNNKATLQNNTVTNNTAGLQVGSSNVPAITNNNIYGNSYNAKLVGVSSQINLPNNWWGTNDIASINQTMYDFKYDFTLGSISFLPILGAPNTQTTPNPDASQSTSPTETSAPTATPHATPNPSSSTPTPYSSTSPTGTSNSTASPKVPELSWLVIVPLLLSVFAVTVLFRNQITESRKLDET
jgi:hypothetical protein